MISRFITDVLINDDAIQKATNGRIYPFEMLQGTHNYPTILWKIITSKPLGQDLWSVGEAWQLEVQVSVFTKSSSASAKLSEMVCKAFNNATLPENILSAQANQIVSSFVNEDETIHYAVRVFINYKFQTSDTNNK